jgi:hypothetical protein
MANAAVELGLIAETTVFLDCFKELPDHRQPGKVIYPLNEVLLLSLLAVLAGAETFCDIARFRSRSPARPPRGRRDRRRSNIRPQASGRAPVPCFAGHGFAGHAP